MFFSLQSDIYHQKCSDFLHFNRKSTLQKQNLTNVNRLLVQEKLSYFLSYKKNNHIKK